MRSLFPRLLTACVLTGVLASCGGGDDAEKKEVDQDIIDPNSSLNTNFKGKIFSIPSPMQTAMLLEETKAPFNEAYLNSLDNLGNYSTEMQKALNLGIYGTDLGYLAIYKQNSLSLKYLTSVEKLTAELGMESAFDKSFMKRFEKNGSNKDSMMVIISDAFKKTDNFLKSGDRRPTSAMILVGGWIESLYLACEINKENASEKIVQRIGEQQETLNTIIEILEMYNKKGASDDLISDMKDLKHYFDDVEIIYDFVQPKTDPKKKLTTLQHKTTIHMESNTLNFIAQKIASIREKIIA